MYLSFLTFLIAESAFPIQAFGLQLIVEVSLHRLVFWGFIVAFGRREVLIFFIVLAGLVSASGIICKEIRQDRIRIREGVVSRRNLSRIDIALLTRQRIFRFCPQRHG